MTINKGFTLIEILIVIVIIGITVGFALLAYGDFGASRRIVFAAEQLVNTLHLAQQQAILENSTLGLRIDNTSYQILKYQKANQWNPISNKGIFKVIYFPKNTQIKLKTDTIQPLGSPVIIINSSGDISAFSLNVGDNKEPEMTTITAKHNGNIHIIRANSK